MSLYNFHCTCVNCISSASSLLFLVFYWPIFPFPFFPLLFTIFHHIFLFSYTVPSYSLFYLLFYFFLPIYTILHFMSMFIILMLSFTLIGNPSLAIYGVSFVLSLNFLIFDSGDFYPFHFLQILFCLILLFFSVSFYHFTSLFMSIVLVFSFTFIENTQWAVCDVSSTPSLPFLRFTVLIFFCSFFFYFSLLLS